MRTLFVPCLTMAFLILGSTAATGQNKFIGTKMCGMCHRTEKQGKQLDVWQKSAHANAYKTLTTAKAAEVAKAKGLSGNPAEVKECLECHATVADAKITEKTFNMKDGVQCETCHGAGSAYKTMTIMKDHAKSVAAGMVDFKDAATIEKSCKTCHNPKSPTYKEFKFEEMRKKIAHPVPKAG